MPSRRLTAALLVLAAALVGVPAGAATAAPPEPAGPAVAALFSTRDPAYEVDESRFGAGEQVSVHPTGSGGVRVVVAGDVIWDFTLDPPEGQPLRTGRYVVEGSNLSRDIASAGLTVGAHGRGLYGDVEVRDWAVGADGVPTRLDIVFRSPADSGHPGYFGQLRLGQDAGSPVAIAATHVAWPQAPIGSVPLWATEWIRNTSPAPVRIGAAATAGTAAADYRLGDDDCSGRTLPPGATCAVRVGFSPREAGPRLARLTIPVDGVDRVVSLGGTGSAGTTAITIAGDDWVSGGGSHTFAEPAMVISAGAPGSGGYTFTNAVPYASDGYPSVQVSIEGADYSVPSVGTYETGDIGTRETRPVLTVGHAGSGFRSTRGVMTVRRFDVDARNTPVAADVDFTLWDRWDPEHPLTGTLRYRARTDYEPPSSPTGLGLAPTTTGTTASWAGSASSDAVGTVARLVAGDGTGATPLSGRPVGDGGATSGVLPALRPAQRYSLVVFAVDATGNVSAPAVLAIPNGAAPEPDPQLFVDVPASHPFYASIQWLGGTGISRGTATASGTAFRPGDALSRQAAAAFLFRDLGDLGFAAPPTPTFPDVPPGHRFFREIEWLHRAGLADGYEDGTFRPEAGLSRQAMAAFMYRQAEADAAGPAAPTFPDVPGDHRYRTEIEWMASSGLASGYPDGTFRPASTLTRQAMAAFLHRFDGGHA